MNWNTKGILAAALLLTSTGIAAAAPARVATDLNVRTGPGTGYGIVDVLPGGIVVDVLACYGGWCEIAWEGRDGFASRSYLDIAQSVAVVGPPAGVVVVPGVIVYEERYYRRPVWDRRGRIIRQAIRRDIRQDRREDRREVRQDRRQDRAADNRRERRIDARQEQRREIRRDRQQNNAQQVRQQRERAQQVRQKRERAQQVRQQRERVRQSPRQERRQERRETRQERRERETTGQR